MSNDRDTSSLNIKQGVPQYKVGDLTITKEILLKKIKTYWLEIYSMGYYKELIMIWIFLIEIEKPWEKIKVTVLEK